MSASSHRPLLVSAIAALLAFGMAADAVAQSAAERAADRRAARQAALDGDKDSKQGAAAVEYPKATRKDPGLRSSSRIAPRIKKVSEAQQEGNLEAAEAAAAEVLGNDRANAYERAITQRLLADLLIDVDNQRAMDLLREAIAADGLGNNEHYGAMTALAQLQMQEDDYAGSLATLDRLVGETSTAKAEIQVLRGNDLYRLDRYDEAIAALEPVVKGNEEARADWAQLLMASYAESGRADEAVALAEEIAAKTPADRRSQLNLANIYLQADDYPKAIAVYERLRQAGELTDPRDYSNLAAMHLNTDGGEQAAIAVLNEGLQKGILEGDYRTYSALAQAYYFSDQFDEAIGAYGKAAPLDDDGESYLNLAKVLAMQGRDAESKAAAQQALDKGLSNPEEARKLLAR